WGLAIDPGNPAIPLGTPPDTLFHPTFLYEVIWNSLGALALLYLSRHIFFQWGRLFAVYLMWYGAGRIVWESIRLDPSYVILGLRTNVWGAIGAVALGVVIMVVQWKRHPEPAEPPCIAGREPQPTESCGPPAPRSSDAPRRPIPAEAARPAEKLRRTAAASPRCSWGSPPRVRGSAIRNDRSDPKRPEFSSA